MNDRTRWRLRWAGAALAVAALGVLVGVVVVRRFGGDRLPGPGSEVYREMVSAFFAGVAALDVDANDRAQASLTRATQMVPEEPAAWADRGLLGIRQGDFEAAAHDLERARELAPDSGAVERLLGLLEGRRGRFAEAITHLRRAVQLEPEAIKTRYELAQEVERQGGPDGEAEAGRLHEEILRLRPGNLAVLLERARLAVKRGDAEALGDVVARLGPRAESWPPRAREQYRALREAAANDLRLAATRVAFLRNVLLAVPAFRQDLDALQTPPGTVGEPIERFLRLAEPAPTPAPPDEGLAFAVEPLATPDATRWDAVLAVSLTGEGPPALFLADGREVRRADAPGVVLPFPGGPKPEPPSSRGILALDWDSDYRTDLVLAGAGGLKLFRQTPEGAFADATAGAGLDAGLVGADYFGAWAADIEADGDLDIVLGPRQGAPAVLRNHGDGTFGVLHPFAGVAGLRDFAWADVDADGDPDAGLLDARGVRSIVLNERAGQFAPPRPNPEAFGRLVALAFADIDSDGRMDLLAPLDDGAVLRASDGGEAGAWEVTEVFRPTAAGGTADRLFVADVDNNGGLDLVGSGPSGGWIALGEGRGGFRPVAAPPGLRITAVADLDGDGQLDLAGVTPEGRPVRATGRGTRDYHWQVVRPRAARIFGDGRINAFGVGGEVGVRAGLLVQTQVIAGPVLHFGLGDRPAADVVRVVWPNGTTQAEFATRADTAVLAEQRLKGSCPFVYAFDGTAVRFVTDFLWRSPLGLRINAQDTAGVAQTEDWVKIRGDQLVPRDGHYDVRITAELWETHYFDHVALLVADHSEGTELFVDERFARQPPPLALHATGPLRPVAYAWDDAGLDVTEVVRARDGRHLDTCGRGQFQGVTRDHWVEVELPEDAPRDRPLVLVAQGWIHPTDSSINVALGQGRHDPPRGLALEVPTPAGDWVVARPDLGFPAGKDKTILVDLSGVFRPGAPRRLRLRTNLEIFWDALAVAAAADDTPVRTRRIAPASADLRPRGYSRMTQEDPGSPERPRYDTIVGTSQRWPDLIGYYTRFGDVRELLSGVDDRYVIANAGDELALRFPAPPPPPPGWVRDFVLIGDGWNKDGDYNTAFSQTVLPLPSHDRPAYDTPPGALEDDPVYRRYPRDWQEYHTRHVTPGVFQKRLKP